LRKLNVLTKAFVRRYVHSFKSTNYIILNLNSRDGLSALWKTSGLCPAQTLRGESEQLDRVAGRQRQDLKENFISVNAEIFIAIFT
jgi:hypothetical protein